MERRREKVSQINRLQASRSYHIREGKIKDQIAFDYSRTVVVWCPTGEYSREEVIKKMESFGELSFVQDRWTVEENGERKWRGALVGYTRPQDAKLASLQLPLYIR